ncbi:MAG: ribosome maturation factor RimM [Candidatus Eisenbacteria bacterium]
MVERAEETWVQIGRVGKPFGLKGEVVIHYTGETPERFRPGAVVQVVTPDGRVDARVATTRPMPAKFVVSFEGRPDVDRIRPWVGCEIQIRASELPPLEEGSYYHFQLLGLEVVDADGRRLGVLAEILETGGNDIYRVCGEQGEILVPAIEDAIASIDVAAGRITLRDLKGLVEP